jgi:hypothetical protein
MPNSDAKRLKRKRRAIPVLPLWAFVVCSGVKLPYLIPLTHDTHNKLLISFHDMIDLNIIKVSMKYSDQKSASPNILNLR